MKEISLQQALEGRTQKELAEMVGKSQGRISQWLKAGKDIRFKLDTEGNVLEIYERKPINSAA